MGRTFHRIELPGIRRTSDHQERRVSLQPVESKMKNLYFEIKQKVLLVLSQGSQLCSSQEDPTHTRYTDI